MRGRHVRFAEHNQNYRAGMSLPQFTKLCRCVSVSRADAAQIVTWLAIKPVNRLPVFAGDDQQPVKRRPVVSPVTIKPKPLTKLFFADLPLPP